MTITFAKPSLIRIGSTPITDHNRSPLSINYERLEKRVRTARGVMRSFYVADKRMFEVSWAMTPSSAAGTVDGYWSGQELRSHYLSNGGPFLFRYRQPSGGEESFAVMWDNFNYDVLKRWGREYWNFSISLVQV